MRTSVQPVTLFGCEVPGMFQVTTGQTPVALVKTDGRKLNVLSVQDRHGGKAGEFGMKAPEVVREIRQIVSAAQWEQMQKPATVKFSPQQHAGRSHRPCRACQTIAKLRPQPTCVWYWVGGKTHGSWAKADAGTRAGLIRMGYFAVNGLEKVMPREFPPEEWFDNFHRFAYREAIAAIF